MSFFQRLRGMLARFMFGRNGVDNLGYTSLWVGLVLSVVDMFVRTGILSTLGMALYVYTLFRLMSRNLDKRREENRRYVQWKDQTTLKAKQFILRQKNRRQYKYFRCPKCKALMRLNRGAGTVTMHCPKCHESFDQKA